MKKFTEKHHAYISARFYFHLKERMWPMWKESFVFAIQAYGEERGKRMAMRTLRDGHHLDFSAYRHYSEWKFSEEFLNSCNNSFFYETEKEANYSYVVTKCAWHDTYKSLGLLDGGDCYCSVIDKSIVRGFNPSLIYLLERSGDDSDLFCKHTQVNAKLDEEPEFDEKTLCNQRDFSYHCAHLLSVFQNTIVSIYGEDGRNLCDNVICDFSALFGCDMTEILIEKTHQSFLTI